MSDQQLDFYSGISYKYVDEHFPKLGRILNIEDGYYLEITHTIVAAIDKDGWFYVLGLLNSSAQKTIRKFAKNYANIDDWEFVKNIYKNKQKFNVNTGELISVSD